MSKRRGWKRGDWLVRDEESGFIEYASNVGRDYYGVLKRKDQMDKVHPQTFVKAGRDVQISYPQASPSITYNTSAYDVSAFVYGTNIPTAIGPAAHVVVPEIIIEPSDPAIPDMAIGSDFVVR
jgi:hypothetical protein